MQIDREMDWEEHQRITVINLSPHDTADAKVEAACDFQISQRTQSQLRSRSKIYNSKNKNRANKTKHLSRDRLTIATDPSQFVMGVLEKSSSSLTLATSLITATATKQPSGHPDEVDDNLDISMDLTTSDMEAVPYDIPYKLLRQSDNDSNNVAVHLDAQNRVCSSPPPGSVVIRSESTKIKLNFSVDRLLGVDDGSFHRPSDGDLCNNNNNNNQNSSHSYSTINDTYSLNKPTDGAICDCCKYLNSCLTSHQRHYPPHQQQHQQKMSSHHSHQTTNQQQQQHGGVLLPSSMDFKLIVRPMPIRPIGKCHQEVNGHQTHSPFTTMSSTLFKYQQHQHNSPLSTVMAPMNGLKSLQINRHFRQTSLNFQTQKAQMDISPSSSVTVVAATNLVSTSGINNTQHYHAQQQMAIGNATIGNGKRKRSWSRAVFSNLQRKGLEIQFQQQKYITKPDRRKLAARLNLTDAQVKVWFQNRRMKWRHTRENLKSGQEKPVPSTESSRLVSGDKSPLKDQEKSEQSYFSDGSSEEISDDDDEIDVVE